MKKICKVFCFSLFFLMNPGFAADSGGKPSQASLSITSEVRPGSVITVEWQGPDNPGDQIALHESGSDDWMSAQYTARGNPVGIGVSDEKVMYELSYHTMTGVLAALLIDCREEVLSANAVCEVSNRVKG